MPETNIIPMTLDLSWDSTEQRYVIVGVLPPCPIEYASVARFGDLADALRTLEQLSLGRIAAVARRIETWPAL